MSLHKNWSNLHKTRTLAYRPRPMASFPSSLSLSSPLSIYINPCVPQQSIFFKVLTLSCLFHRLFPIQIQNLNYLQSKALITSLSSYLLSKSFLSSYQILFDSLIQGSFSTPPVSLCHSTRYSTQIQNSNQKKWKNPREKGVGKRRNRSPKPWTSR